MRCPHCGYNSFAHLPRCKKCGRELHEIRPLSRALTDSAVAAETPINEALTQEVIPTTDAQLEATPKLQAKVESKWADTDPLSQYAPALTPEDLFLLWGAEDKREMDRGTPKPVVFKPVVGKSYSIVTRRFVASVVDIAAILGTWLLFYVLVDKLLWEPQTPFFDPLLNNPGVRGGFYLLFILIALGYFNIFHYMNGQTLGKMLTHVRVVSIDGEPLSLTQVLLRTCGGFVSALCLGYGYMLIWFSANKRGWNDVLADTEVISSEEINIED